LCLNPIDNAPDDLDDVILSQMIKEVLGFYQLEFERAKEN
jgi:hypothetical protein